MRQTNPDTGSSARNRISAYGNRCQPRGADTIRVSGAPEELSSGASSATVHEYVAGSCSTLGSPGSGSGRWSVVPRSFARAVKM